MAETVRIDGLRELRAALMQLPKNVERNVLSRSVGHAAALVREAAKTRAPVWTGPVSKGHPPPGTLKRAIITKNVSSRAYKSQWIVTVRTGKKQQFSGNWMKGGQKNRDAYYWRWVEFGHRVGNRSTGTLSQAGNRKRSTRRNVHEIGFVAPHPFMRPAWESTKNAALRTIIDDIAKGVETEAAKVRRT
jgi:HK97 gp10 family phage protein